MPRRGVTKIFMVEKELFGCQLKFVPLVTALNNMEGLRNGKNVFVTTKKAIFCANNPFFGVERQG